MLGNIRLGSTVGLSYFLMSGLRISGYSSIQVRSNG